MAGNGPRRYESSSYESSSYESITYEEIPPTSHTGLRIAAGIAGAAALVLGVVLLFHPTAAAGALALLIGLAFVVAGVLEMVVGWSLTRRAWSFVLGGILVVGGILAIAWPSATLLTLAVIVGLALIVNGGVRIALAVAARDVIAGWGWLVFAGVLNVLFGIAALVWPHVTVLVLSLILGLQIVLFAALLLLAALWPRHGNAGAW